MAMSVALLNNHRMTVHPLPPENIAIECACPRRRRFIPTATAWVVFMAFAVRVTWPMPLDIHLELPLGTETVATVPLFNLWTVWWNADRAAVGFVGYWDAPIFHLTQGTFAFSEAQPTTVLVAPLVWFTGTPVAAYNVYLLMTLCLNGFCAYRLLLQRGCAWWPAVCGGLLIETLPFVVWQLGVLQLTVLWASLWTVAALWRWSEHPQWPRALEVGLAFGTTYLTCNYYGLFLVLLLTPLAMVLCWKRFFSPRTWGHAVLVALVAGGLCGPVIVVQQSHAQRHSWKRDIGMVLTLSAHVRDYTNTPWPQWFERYEMPERDRETWTLGPAWLQWLCAGAGLVCGLRHSRLRGWTWFALGFGTLSFLLSLGPRAELWNISPYRWLWAYVPGVAQIRSPFRFAVFVQVAVTWLAVIFIQTLVPQVENAKRLSRRQRVVLTLAWLPAVLAGLVLMMETRPVNRACYRWPPERWPQWVEFLREETPPDTTIVCLPFAKGADVQAYERATEWMMWGTRHRRRMINGYSGYFPESYLQFKGTLERFPATGAATLAESKIDLAVIDRRAIPPEHIAGTEATSTWEWLYSDDVNAIEIYRIQPPPSPDNDQGRRNGK